MDELIEKLNVYGLGALALYRMFESFALLEFPLAAHVTMFSNIIYASLAVLHKNHGKTLYWLYGLVSVIVAAFGGGILAPIMIGQPASIVSHELAIPMCVVCWYLVHNLKFDRLLETMPAKIVWGVLMALYKTHSAIKAVKMAKAALAAGPFYPIPLVGPIVIGTIMGCGGAFMPLDKGLSPISAGAPWALQAAFMSSAFYHLVVNDKYGPVGAAVRAVVGTHSHNRAVVIIAICQIASQLAQTIFSPSANLFTPVHKFLYLVFQVQGPPSATPKAVGSADANPVDSSTVGWEYRTRLFLERLLESFRVMVVVLAVLLHIYFTVPPTTIYSEMSLKSGGLHAPEIFTDIAGTGLRDLLNTPAPERYTALHIGDTIGTCQFLKSVRSCSPFLLTLDHIPPGSASGSDAFKLLAFKGSSLTPSTDPHWTLDLAPLQNAKKLQGASLDNVKFTVDNQGLLKLLLVNGSDATVLWNAKSSLCKSDAQQTGYTSLSLDPTTGNPSVKCQDGSVFPIVV